jgi:hypothetical protein
VTLKEGMKGLGVPSKTYNLMAAGKPLFYVGDTDSEIHNYIEKYDCGWSFTWNQISEMEFFLNNISCRDTDLLVQKGLNSKKAVESDYKKEDVLNLF